MAELNARRLLTDWREGEEVTGEELLERTKCNGGKTVYQLSDLCMKLYSRLKDLNGDDDEAKEICEEMKVVVDNYFHIELTNRPHLKIGEVKKLFNENEAETGRAIAETKRSNRDTVINVYDQPAPSNSHMNERTRKGRFSRLKQKVFPK